MNESIIIIDWCTEYIYCTNFHSHPYHSPSFRSFRAQPGELLTNKCDRLYPKSYIFGVLKTPDTHLQSAGLFLSLFFVWMLFTRAEEVLKTKPSRVGVDLSVTYTMTGWRQKFESIRIIFSDLDPTHSISSPAWLAGLVCVYVCVCVSPQIELNNDLQMFDWSVTSRR